MSVRLRVFTNIIVAILVLNAAGVLAGFFLFWFVANPFIIGDRLAENAMEVAAGYFLLGGVVVLVLTGVGALWVIGVNSKNVSGPLRRLKRAAKEIRDGNLGYELPVSGHDEFSELAASFEQMRIRLKDSTRLKEKAEAELRAMMACVTHDLKTPITSIIGYSEGIRDGVADTPEKIRDYAAVIIRKAWSLHALAEDLTLLSKLENAQLPLDKREEDFGALVEGLAQEFSCNEPEMGLTMRITDSLYVMIDREKIARVIINLLQNCVRYRKPEQPGPEVSITLVRQGGSAHLTVSDNGMGVSQSDLPHLFDHFYRADASRGMQSGSGLGLSIARQLVNLHKGKIWIVGNPERGLSVNIALPIAGGGGGGGG